MVTWMRRILSVLKDKDQSWKLGHSVTTPPNTPASSFSFSSGGHQRIQGYFIHTAKNLLWRGGWGVPVKMLFSTPGPIREDCVSIEVVRRSSMDFETERKFMGSTSVSNWQGWNRINRVIDYSTVRIWLVAAFTRRGLETFSPHYLNINVVNSCSSARPEIRELHWSLITLTMCLIFIDETGLKYQPPTKGRLKRTVQHRVWLVGDNVPTQQVAMMRPHGATSDEDTVEVWVFVTCGQRCLRIRAAVVGGATAVVHTPRSSRDKDVLHISTQHDTGTKTTLATAED